MDARRTRTQLRDSLLTIEPIVTLSKDGLVLTALGWGLAGEPAYETVTAAMQSGHLELREQGSGTVPVIEAVTKAMPVVIFAGDTVVGGKQNRIINITVWLSADTVTPIPVSCLEHGRWNHGVHFAASRKVDYLMRAKMSAQMADVAMMETRMADDAPARAPRRRTYAANQAEVWSEIAAKEARSGGHSPTAALHDLYEREAIDLDGFVRAFPCPAGASGIAVAIGGRLQAIEMFDATSTLAEQWPRLVEGAASAYADHRRAVAAGYFPAPRHRHTDEGAIARMLKRAAAATDGAVVGSSVGEGLDVRLAGTRVRGGALLVGEHPVHLELFRVES